MAVKRWRRRVLVAGALLLGLGVTAWAIPWTRSRIKALGVVSDLAGLPLPRPWTRQVTVEEVRLAADVTGDMYDGGEDAPVILFVPGATRKGRDDARVIEAATALAQAGRRVFVPELRLYERIFHRSDVERLVAAIQALAPEERVGIVGFSYGGSFALIAASDAAVTGDVEYIATFGAYYDLTHVIQGVTTGSTTLDGDLVDFDTVEEARGILLQAAARLVGGAHADELDHALEARDASGLPPDAARVYELLENTDPRRSDELVAALPETIRATLGAFSPSNHVEDLDVPVFVMQAKKDAATPWTEAVLLERALPRARLVTLDHFSHVDPPGIGGWLSDGPQAWRFVSWILEAQE
ncbi:MAG: alpha/beta hydrolase [Actinomycetota bacterium]|nr:alpha/beta hydrolase [Actinomycetota bacterium]